MDAYRSLAAILARSASGSIEPATLVASQLSTAPNDQRRELARILKELLDLRVNLPPYLNLQKTLHDYIRTLIETSNLEDVSKDFRLAVELANESFLDKVLDETEASLDMLLRRSRDVHMSSDDASEVDFGGFYEKHMGRATLGPGEGSLNIASEMEEDRGNELEGHDQENTDRSLHDTVVRQLRFWNFLFIVDEGRQFSYHALYQRIGQVLPARLLPAMALRNFNIAKAASNTLGCFLDDFHDFFPGKAYEMLWDGVNRLVSAEVHVDLALALWLRWIAVTTENVKPTQEILAQDQYWALIQKCLATGFSERRKYSLHLLMGSISLVQEPTNTRTFLFDPKKRKHITAAWTKFTTLIEITSLSTSPNQLRDATPDLERLLDPSSCVPSSWLVVLVSLGFQSGSGGVSRAFWDILLSLEKKRLGRLFDGSEGMKLLQDTVLPYAAYASNFVVGRSMPEKCDHGLQLSQWLGSLLCSGDADAKRVRARAIVAWVVAREDNLFAPARAWVLRGLLEGVKGQAVFDQVNDLASLVNIAKMRRFTKLKVDICVAIVLRLLLAVDIRKVGFGLFWNALADIVLTKEYLLSEEFISRLNEQFGPCLVDIEQLRHVEKVALVENINETPSTRAELLQAALVIYWMSCQDGVSTDPQLKGLSEWIDSFRVKLMTQKTCLDFWDILQGSPQLFARVNKLFDVPVVLHSLLSGYSVPEAASTVENSLANLLKTWPADIFRGKPSMQITDVSVVTMILTSRWSRLKETQGQKYEQAMERDRAYWAVISAGAADFVKSLGENPFEMVTVHDIVGMVNAYDLPTLGHNKHDNVEMTATAGLFIGAILRLLNQAIIMSTDLIDTPTVSEILRTLPRLMRFLENESLLRTLDVIRSVATKAPQQLSECQNSQGAVNLDSLLLKLWEVVDAATLRSDFIKVYHGFIETIFHPVIISDAVDNKYLKETLSTIAAEIMRLGNGKRSIRPAIAKAIRNVFLHAPEHASIIGRSTWLIEIISELINYSQGLKDMDFVVEHPLTVTFDEVAPGVDHYREYYGDREIFAQVYMFDMLSRMDEKDPSQVTFVKILREKLFTPWTENTPGMSVWISWKRHTHLQTLVLLERFVEADEAEEFLDRVINKALSHEPHPRFRFLFEWIVALCILRFPERRSCIWPHLQFPVKQNPKLQVSLLRVGLMVARGLPSSLREEYFTELVYTAIPLTSNAKVVVRHQAIAMTLEFWEDAKRYNFTTLTNNPIFARVNKAVTTSNYYQGSPSARDDFRTFDAVGNYTLTGIFSGTYLHGGDAVEAIPVGSFPAGGRIPPGTVTSTTTAAVNSGKVEYKRFDIAQLTTPTSSVPTALQTKASAPSPRTGDLIVVASLLDNAVNLGGVSRVSEIMGVRTLTVGSLATTKTADFASVSVHSESWLDMIEVPVTGIAAFLRMKRVDGYVAVGVEQTDRSLVLGARETRFPAKTVLLMGTEKFGIPAELLGELDWCVEIPQRGRTRSMNVQTAAAVVLYEACRQDGAG